MDFLDENKSLELFSSYAFEEKSPSTGFQKFALEAVNYVQGHPLALIVLGRFLYGKTVRQWVSELNRLKLHPNEEIQRVLRLSYDGLNYQQQNILLYIACLFIGENSEFVASILDGCNFFADTNMKVLVDKTLITFCSDMPLQMHGLIQAMARAIVREESRRLLISSNIYNKVAITEAVEVLVLSLEKFSQKVRIDANDFARMKRLRILKIYQEEKPYEQKLELEGHNVIFSGKKLYYLSNELSLFYWHGCPFEYLPADFYPENIVAIDLSYSNIKYFWTTPKCFRRLKVMKLRYCCNLTTTPDFSEITNLEELSLEGCVNLVSIHPSIGMLERLVVLNLAGCLKVDQHPSFVSSLINLASLSFGGQGMIQPRWCTSLAGFIWKQQHPQRSVSLAGLHMLKELNFSYCNLVQVPEGIGGLSCLKELYLGGNNLLEVPESIGGLSCLKKLHLEGNNLLEVPESIEGLSCLKVLCLNGNNLLEVPESIGGLSCLKILDLKGNNFTSLPRSLSQLSHLEWLRLNGCKKLEVLPELPHSLGDLYASDCTSLREVAESSKDPFRNWRNRSNNFENCPKLFKNVTIDTEGSISKTRCLDSSITSQGFIHQLSAYLGYLGVPTNGCELFKQDTGLSLLDIVYHGNSIPEWFTNRSTGNHVKVELPSDWCYNKFRGYGTCVVFKRKKPHKLKGYSVKNFDRAYLNHVYDYYIPFGIRDYFEKEVIGIQDSYMIWLHYTTDTWGWKEAKNFVTFCFEENNEDIEVKECGVRVVYDEENNENVTNLSLLQDLPTPSGGAMSYFAPNRSINWSW